MPITSNESYGYEEIALTEVAQVKRRFLRSVNLERDFYTPDPLEGYIFTSSALTALERISAGIHQPHARAFSITGPYGTGKSAFGLFAAKSLATPLLGAAELRERVRRQEPMLADRVFPDDGTGFWPVLITGTRQPIAGALMEGLFNALANYPHASAHAVANELRRKFKSLMAAQVPSAQEVVKLYGAAAALIRKKDDTCRGLFLIIDEAGKFLEYSAIHPERADIQALQEMAEFAVRSQDTPLLLVTILHQAFDEYAHRLSTVQRTEWQKVQGRFADVAFGDGPEETVHLIAQAIEQQDKERVDGLLEPILAQQIEMGRETEVFPPTVTVAEFRNILRQTFPLHALTLRVMPYLFRRFGQSERSLFTFLSSDEPFGFQEFLRARTLSEENVPLLRLDHLYDYVVTALGSTLYSHPTAKLWSETEEALFRLRNRDELQSRLIKTIGLLQIIGEQTRIAPTKKVLTFALRENGITDTQIEEAIQALETGTLITYRQFKQSYRLYEGSDIDIDARLREARAYLAHATDGVKIAQQLGVTPPVVARRHSYDTGTLRYFEVRYCRPETMEQEIAAGHPQSDGLLLLCLASDAVELIEAEESVRKILATRPDVIVGLSVETETLHEAAVAVECLQWVQHETPELRTDKVAAREVRERLLDATTAFQTEWERLLRPRGAAEGGRWYYMGEHILLGSYRQLQTLVSDACAKTYPHTPRLLNELVNRRQLSSTATAARRNLIEGMIKHRTEPRFRIESFPPEASMYASLFENTGIHRQLESNPEIWGLFPPLSERDPALAQVWQEIEDFLFGGLLEPKSLEELNARLRGRPYGLADGIIPVLIGAVLLYHETDIVVYEEGRFVTDLDAATFERMIKRPEDYKLQGCKIAGERQKVLERFARGLLRNGEEVTLVSIIRQLYRAFNRLPEYTTRTRRLDADAQALRNIFKESKEPEQFLFVDLPRLLGARPFVEYEADADNMDGFFVRWNATMLSIMGAYASLLGRIENGICVSFDVKDWEELKARANAIQPHIAEPKLKAFVSRAEDTTLERDKWLESVGQVVLGRPPYLWSDAEEDRFYNLLPPLVSAFQHSELLLFEKRQANHEEQTALRLSVTLDTGEENARVVFVPIAETQTIQTLAENLRRVVEEVLEGQSQDVRLAVISQVAQEILRSKNHVG